MPDRIESEICNCEPDSETVVRDIDVSQYAKEAVPKGYVRVTHVSENNDPTSDNYSRSDN